MRSRLCLIASALAACSTLAACAGTASQPPQALQPPTGAAQSAGREHTRLVASPDASIRFGLPPQGLRTARRQNDLGFWAMPDKKQPTLFVSDLNGGPTGQIRIYPANVKDPTQSGSITTGIDLPVNVATDKHGTLYVANNGSGTVTEYPLGATSPSVTLSTQILDPNGVAVDSKGTVYVTSGASIGECYVLEFPKGATAPSAQVGNFGLPIGLAVDKDDNLYVADATADTVWEVPKGSTSPQNLGLTGLSDDTGLALDAAGDLYVASYQTNSVPAYHPGQTAPFVTITNDLDEPYTLAFEKNGTLFVGNYIGYVTAYKKGSETNFESFSNGIVSPVGLALYPGGKT